MKSVNVGELRNHLSKYLRVVRHGESVLVRDRDRVIARIEPAGETAADSDEERIARLEAKGIIRRGSGQFPLELLARRPRVSVNAVAVLLRERDEGR
jgi:antitoxin (DNA-binding transcriptional repressor) of toxin-antitoxin stability system